ncbi:MAG: amino acid adenylation domain protein, partial [Anaerocolumna sp.]|nr:amino acid adenylation domain protein [Anaerocolumna sp.]
MNIIEQNILLSSGKFEKEEKFWREKLRGDLELTSFSYDSEKKSGDKYEVAWMSESFQSELSNKIGNISNNSYFGSYIILLSAILYLLHRYRRLSDIIVGMPVFKQKVKSIMEKNLLPLTTIINDIDEINYKSYLMNIQDTVKSANENQNIPDGVIRRILSDNKNNNNDVLNTIVLLENIHDKDLVSDIKADTVFCFNIKNNEITLNVRYNSKVYREDSIKQIIKHTIKFLSIVVNNPEVKLIDICLLSRQEKDQIINEFNDTKTVYPRNKSVSELFEEQVKNK